MTARRKGRKAVGLARTHTRARARAKFLSKVLSRFEYQITPEAGRPIRRLMT